MVKSSKRLKSTFERLKSIDDTNVFVDVLNEFCVEVFSGEFKKIITKIDKKYQQKIKPLNKLEKAANKEMDEAYTEIREFVKQHNIIDSWILQCIEEFKDPSKYQAGKTSNKFIAMNMIQIALYQNYKSIGSRFAMKAGTVELTKKLFPKFWKWNFKKIELENTNEVLDGLALNKLRGFLNCYNLISYEAFKKELIEKDDNVKILKECRHSFTVGYLFGQPRSYYDTELNASRPFDIQMFKQYAGRVLNIIEECLDVDHICKKISNDFQFRWKYTFTSAEFIANDKLIKFKKSKQPSELLKVINEIKKNKISFLSAWNKMFEGCNPLKELTYDQERKIGFIIKSINDNFKKNGLPNFLIIIREDSYDIGAPKKSYIMISSSYKRI